MITILRLSHRLPRDSRVTTHVALVARAFGADNLVYSGQKDKSFEDSVKSLVNRFGGKFLVEYVKNPFNYLKEKSKIVNLSVYGIPLQKKIKEIKKIKNLIIIVGSEKVPIEYYKIADYNISITSQPHSEVAALAIFLHEYFSGKEFNKEFENAKIKIIPNQKGKFKSRM